MNIAIHAAIQTAINSAIHDSRSIGRWLRTNAFSGMRQSGQDTGTRPGIQELATNRILEIKQASGVTIECLEGSVWVTLDGEMRDVILAAGHSFNVDRNQRTLIQALDTARVRLIHPPCTL